MREFLESLLGKNVVALVNELKLLSPSYHGFASIIYRSNIFDDLKAKTVKKAGPNKKQQDIIDNYDWAVGLIKITRTPMLCKAPGGYARGVQNQQEKAGVERDFVAEECRYSNPVEKFPNEILRESKKTPESQLYLRLYVGSGKPESKYYNAKGQDVTHKIDDEFRTKFFKKDYGSKKQTEAGVSEEKQVKPRMYKAENVIYFQTSEACYNVIPNDLLEAFDLELVA
ncbi:hypothetical protein N9948_01730 [bacterium]|nr:hypothetical protein [bacterium]